MGNQNDQKGFHDWTFNVDGSAASCDANRHHSIAPEPAITLGIATYKNQDLKLKGSDA